MDNEAVIENNERVWKGRLVATAKSLGIPEGSYSKVVTRLRSMGCIEQVTRGYRGTALSTYILLFPPTPELWRATEARGDEGRLTAAPTSDRVARAVEDLQKQLGGINVVSALANLETRLHNLERQVSQIATDVSPTQHQQN